MVLNCHHTQNQKVWQPRQSMLALNQTSSRSCCQRANTPPTTHMRRTTQQRTSVGLQGFSCAAIALHGLKVDSGRPRGRRLKKLAVLHGGQAADHSAALVGEDLAHQPRVVRLRPRKRVLTRPAMAGELAPAMAGELALACQGSAVTGQEPSLLPRLQMACMTAALTNSTAAHLKLSPRHCCSNSHSKHNCWATPYQRGAQW